MAINIERINSKLEGEFYFRGKKWSVPFTVTGDAVQFKLKRRGRKFSMEVLHIEKDEKSRENLPLIEPVCPVFASCGGCRAQHLDYAFQLKLKTDPVISAMENKFNILPEIIPAAALKGHRHRMDFTVDGISVGFRPAGDFSKIVDTETCPVQSEKANQTLKIFRETLKQFPGIGYRREDLTGSVKYATIRWGISGALILTCDETNFSKEENSKMMGEFTDFLIKKIKTEFNDSLSLILCMSSEGSEISCTPGGRSIYGRDFFSIEIGETEFNVPYDSFFQPNPKCFNGLIEWSTERLIRNSEMIESGELLDLYSGSGILSSLFAGTLERKIGNKFEQITGYDFIMSSVANAESNFKNITADVEFIAADLNQKFKEGNNPFINKNISLIIADPPRAGLSPSLVKNIAEHSKAPLFLYISCNPESQVRDLEMLGESYTVSDACIADCFPHTGHLEQAVLLKRKNT